MTPSVLPLISEHDYPEFQKVIIELQHTSYEEWHRDHEVSMAYRQARNGAREISISTMEFHRWLKGRNEAAHLELLWVCAEDKAEQTIRLRA